MSVLCLLTGQTARAVRDEPDLQDIIPRLLDEANAVAQSCFPGVKRLDPHRPRARPQAVDPAGLRTRPRHGDRRAGARACRVRARRRICRRRCSTSWRRWRSEWRGEGAVSGVRIVSSSSWPGLTRPSTCFLCMSRQRGAWMHRVKPGHDELKSSRTRGSTSCTSKTKSASSPAPPAASARPPPAPLPRPARAGLWSPISGIARPAGKGRRRDRRPRRHLRCRPGRRHQGADRGGRRQIWPGRRVLFQCRPVAQGTGDSLRRRLGRQLAGACHEPCVRGARAGAGHAGARLRLSAQHRIRRGPAGVAELDALWRDQDTPRWRWPSISPFNMATAASGFPCCVRSRYRPA